MSVPNQIVKWINLYCDRQPILTKVMLYRYGTVNFYPRIRIAVQAYNSASQTPNTFTGKSF